MVAEKRREELVCGGWEVGQEWGGGEQGEKRSADAASDK